MSKKPHSPPFTTTEQRIKFSYLVNADGISKYMELLKNKRNKADLLL